MDYIDLEPHYPHNDYAWGWQKKKKKLKSGLDYQRSKDSDLEKFISAH